MMSCVWAKSTSGLRSTSAWSGTAARSSARTSFSGPLTARPIGVRTASTMTASDMCVSFDEAPASHSRSGFPRRRTRRGLSHRIGSRAVLSAYGCQVAEAVIQLRVLRRGERADELLARLASQFERDGLEPDRSGLVSLRVPERGPQAWERVREALDALGADWRQWLYLSPRPRR